MSSSSDRLFNVFAAVGAVLGQRATNKKPDDEEDRPTITPKQALIGKLDHIQRSHHTFDTTPADVSILISLDICESIDALTRTVQAVGEDLNSSVRQITAVLDEISAELRYQRSKEEDDDERTPTARD